MSAEEAPSTVGTRWMRVLLSKTASKTRKRDSLPCESFPGGPIWIGALVLGVMHYICPAVQPTLACGEMLRVDFDHAYGLQGLLTSTR
jgi:hypothetical protein